MNKKFIAISIILTLVTLVECEINALELSRLFLRTHREKQLSYKQEKQREKRDSSFGFNDNFHNLMNAYQKYSQDAIIINDFATTGIEVAAKLLSNKLKRQQGSLDILSTIKAPEKFCPFKEQINCNINFPYRTLDGSCNNIANPWWGKAGMPFKRWMPADYSDQFKLNEPRKALDGNDLPNPRILACALNGDFHDIEPFITHMFMQWGQFVNHDITSLSITREDDPDKSICKTCTKTHKCLPIMISSNTTCNCISTMRHECIEFTRSSASFGDPTCQLGQREQLNMQTSFLDGSHIYGITLEENNNLRDRKNGKRGMMRVQSLSNNPRHDLLPQSSKDRPSDCLDFTNTTKCFIGGDDRVNQNPPLMCMHTLFVREHNRIATILGNLNPLWGDETIFQETRRIIIAQIQHISYNEYLPILLGPNLMKLFSLTPSKDAEKISIYDPKFDPRISNEYSAAAGRFGHSMIRTEYSRVNSEYKSAGSTSFLLRNSYFRANQLYDDKAGGLESIVRGLLKDPLMKIDRWFSTELTQHLFETKDKFNRPFHFDLVAININRGRDHGIRGYTKFREFCGLQSVKTWQDMKMFISNEVVDIFTQFYSAVDDVDLFLGLLSEFKTEGSIVGPTLGCLLGLQFQGMKFGDRFWYETNQLPGDFTQNQLTELKKFSLSKLLCRNMNITPKVQPHSFLSFQLEGNELVDCESLPDIDWNFWRI